MAELDIEGLSLRFGGLTVLEAVSLAIEPAELFALIGPNGAGKTSVLNCISGIYPARVASASAARTSRVGRRAPWPRSASPAPSSTSSCSGT
jgi:branched-chain amino acid transport system ATP-binding protein